MTPSEASGLMKHGIALLNQNTEASLTEAVGLFDRALEFRRSTAEPGDHWGAYLTAASWMNRGDALTRLARPELLTEAVQCYDEAVALMRTVPLEENPLYRRRLAIAWMNRGITLHQQETAEGFGAATESFDQAIEVVREHAEHVLLAACAWMNRGNALLRTEPSRPADARASAGHALELLTELELSDALAAETALKARYILCQAVAELLVLAPESGQRPDLISSATDAVEDGIQLGGQWAARGEKAFRPLLREFFRFGATAYREYQPRFLPEFVRENLDPAARELVPFSSDLEMHLVGADALESLTRKLQADGFAKVHTPEFDLLLEALQTLQWVESRMATLQAPA